jgi:TRAP-type mannitol/chloroaromatic compound transport system substrate-binding protein
LPRHPLAGDGLAKIARRGVKVARTSVDVLAAQLKAWDALIAEHSKDRFFAKVIASQKAWVSRTAIFLRQDSDGEVRDAAYQHFFG